MINVIYKISNTINDKIYIGSANKFKERVSVHKSYLRKGAHHSKKLQNHVNKYGIDCLIFEIMEKCESKDELIPREQYYLDDLKPFFNILKNADSRLGIKHTKETILKIVEKRRNTDNYRKGIKRPKWVIDKIVESRKGYKPSEETKKKISESLKNRVLSEQALINIRNASKKRKGSKLSKEHIEKIKKSQLTEKNYMKGRFGNLHHNYGKKHSIETINKLKNRGRKIIDINTGIIYNNISHCCEQTKIPRGTMGKYLSNLVKSKTNFKYYEEII